MNKSSISHMNLLTQTIDTHGNFVFLSVLGKVR